jgi:hypothetical protein
MNNLVKIGAKIGAVSSLALAGVAAHATITLPTSSGNPGHVVLFADIFNGATLVDAYVGDTQANVVGVAGGTNPGNYAASKDSNLSAFLGEVGSNTLVWSVMGGGGVAGGAPVFVTTAPKSNPIATNGQNLIGSWLSGFDTNINNINGIIGAATSLKIKDNSLLSGTGYNPQALAADAANWYGNQVNFITGEGTVTTLYSVTATGQQAANTATVTPRFNVTLDANGLEYSAISAVPLPAAVWLLGSGLLGLVGVARRKIAAA